MNKLIATSVLIIMCGPSISHSAAQTRAKRPRPSTASTGNQTTAYSLDSIGDVLWWLPEDTETVSVVRGPYQAPLVEPSEDMQGVEFLTMALRMEPLGIFQTVRKGSFFNDLVGKTILFAVEGGRRFHPPTSLGDTLFEGCSIIILEQGLAEKRNLLITLMASRAKRVQTVAGQQVMSFQEKMEEDTVEFSIAIPAPNVLLCATDHNYLGQVLNRMRQRGSLRALPESLPEWRQVNTGAQFWAVRHYDATNAERDETSPLSGRERAANWPDKQAVGIVFYFDPIESKIPTVRYLSANRNALKIFSDEQAKASQPGLSFRPQIRLKEQGVIEMLVPLDEREQTAMFVLILFGLLGHAVYV